jgi:hypothetical protein
LAQIPKGPFKINVQGERYHRGNINKYVPHKPYRFSLTPRNAYQEEAEWPKGEFWNVNTANSTSTTASNWLGYVNYTDKPIETKLARFVNLGLRVHVWGFAEDEDSERNIVLTVPHELDMSALASEVGRQQEQLQKHQKERRELERQKERESKKSNALIAIISGIVIVLLVSCCFWFMGSLTSCSA